MTAWRCNSCIAQTTHTCMQYHLFLTSTSSTQQPQKTICCDLQFTCSQLATHTDSSSTHIQHLVNVNCFLDHHQHQHQFVVAACRRTRRQQQQRRGAQFCVSAAFVLLMQLSDKMGSHTHPLSHADTADTGIAANNLSLARHHHHVTVASPQASER